MFYFSSTLNLLKTEYQEILNIIEASKEEYKKLFLSIEANEKQENNKVIILSLLLNQYEKYNASNYSIFINANEIRHLYENIISLQNNMYQKFIISHTQSLLISDIKNTISAFKSQLSNVKFASYIERKNEEIQEHSCNIINFNQNILESYVLYDFNENKKSQKQQIKKDSNKEKINLQNLDIDVIKNNQNQTLKENI